MHQNLPSSSSPPESAPAVVRASERPLSWKWRALLGLVVAAAVSLWLHFGLVIALLLLGSHLLPGGDVLGEKGALGAGGPELEISVSNEPDPGRPTAPPTPPTPLTDEPTPPPAAPATRPKQPAKPPKLDKDAPPAATSDDDAPAPPQPSDQGAPSKPPRPSTEALPPGEERRPPRSSGRAAGDANSISAQRGRLARAVECDDAVQGVWVGSKYLPYKGEWYVFTLSIKRQGTRLTGSIQSRFWAGFASQSRPPVCDVESERLHAVVSMPAMGTVDGPNVSFHGTSWRLDKLLCGSLLTFGYSLDEFEGEIDERAHEFRSISSDGDSIVNEPILFRRVGCL